MKVPSSGLKNSNERAKIESACKIANLSLKQKKSKNLVYSAVILKNLNRRNLELATKFFDFFKKNLINSYTESRSAVKPSAHQALNDLVNAGELKLEELKQITKDAWKIVFKDAARHKSKSEIIPKSAAQSLTNEIEGSQSIKAPGGFLWKPITDNPPHGLAILLPSEWTGIVQGLIVIDPKEHQVLARGQDGGVGNGNRQHFRFENQGADFPNGAIVRVEFKDGSIKEITITDTSARLEGHNSRA